VAAMGVAVGQTRRSLRSPSRSPLNASIVGRTNGAPMGLEVVEFILDLEEALGISIPDRDAESWGTGRGLVSYVSRRMPEVDPGFGSASARWTPEEVEQFVEGLLAKTARRANVSLDVDLKNLFH
jgi:hypothetical protein